MPNWFTNILTRSAFDNPKNSLSEVVRALSGDMDSTSVSADSSMSLSAFYACVKILSEDIASMPLSVMRRVGDRIERADDHPVHELIAHSPSKLYSSFDFRSAMMAHANIRGNGYAYIRTRPTDGRIVEFEILEHPESVSIETVSRTDGSRDLIYIYRPAGKDSKRVFNSDEIIHIKNITTDGVVGLSTVATLRKTLGEAINTLKYGNDFYRNGARLTGVIEVPQKLDTDALKNLRQSWSDLHEGPKAKTGTAILEQGSTYKPISLSPVDADFLQNRKFGVEEIARIFRIPLHLLQHLDRATNNNIEQQSIDYVVNTLRPWIKRHEQEYNRKLFTQGDKERGYFVRFNMEGLLRGDSKSRSEYYSKMFNIGAMSQNEIRNLEKMNPIEGGDTHYTPVNLVDDEGRVTQNTNTDEE